MQDAILAHKKAVFEAASDKDNPRPHTVQGCEADQVAGYVQRYRHAAP